MNDTRPLIAHLLFRFDTGGLENGVVNLINHLPAERYRHAVIALDEVVDAFAARVERADVRFVSLRKPPGHGWRLYPRAVRLFRALRPAIVHSRNLAALELQPAAWAAGVPVRVHGEHGRDVDDLDGSARRYRWIRRAYRPFVHRYVALSADLAHYLATAVGVPGERITRICNGVDARRFRPAHAADPLPEGCPFNAPGLWRVGTVGRLQPVKNQLLLARAFVRALQRQPSLREVARLVIVGDGPSRAEVAAVLQQAGLADLAWFAGDRRDVPQLLRALHCFVLPSLAEGISNTILEAMASGLPVVATRVGGNAELVDDPRTGRLVPSGDVEALSRAIVELATDRPAGVALGRAGRLEVERRFSLDAMVAAYGRLYDELLAERNGSHAGVPDLRLQRGRR